MASILLHQVGGRYIPTSAKPGSPGKSIRTKRSTSSLHITLLRQPITASPYFVSVMYETTDEIKQRRGRRTESEAHCEREEVQPGNIISFQILHYNISLNFVEETEYIHLEY